MSKRKILLAGIFLSACITNANSQSTFDFWCGNWNVFSVASGNLVGENRVYKILDDMIILENWSDVINVHGKSFTVYDSSQQCWKQTWVDNTGAITELTGILSQDTMVFLSRPRIHRDGKTEINRMTIIKTTENELFQKGEVSFDYSQTWQTNYFFRYARQGNYSLTNRPFTLKLYGVKLDVQNLETAKTFYTQTLGFHVDRSYQQPNEIQLYTNSYRIILHENQNMKMLSEGEISSVSITLMVNNIDSTYRDLKSKGVKFLSEQRRKEGVGFSMKILDPFGNQLSVMQLTFPNAPKVSVEPKIYNCGLYVASMEKAREFYKGVLGLVELTERYLPNDLPLGYTDRTFSFMLHQNRSEFKHTTTPNMKIVFTVSDKRELITLLRKNNIIFTESNGIVTLTDNNGVQSEILYGPGAPL